MWSGKCKESTFDDWSSLWKWEDDNDAYDNKWQSSHDDDDDDDDDDVNEYEVKRWWWWWWKWGIW